MTCQLKIGECGRLWPMVEKALIDSDDVLVVGWRPGSQSEMYHRFMAVGVPWVMMIDVHEPNVVAWNAAVANLRERDTEFNGHCLDVRGMLPIDSFAVVPRRSEQPIDLLMRSFSLYVWQHGPEHLDKEEAIAVIKQMQDHADVGVILEAPIGFQPNPPGLEEANPAEQHRSVWQPEEFEALGFTTELSREGDHTIAVWLKKPISDYASLVGAHTEEGE